MKRKSWNDIFQAVPAAGLILCPKFPDTFIVENANEAFLTLIGKSAAEIKNKEMHEAFPKSTGLQYYNSDTFLNDLLKALKTGNRVSRVDQVYEVWDKTDNTFKNRYFSSENIPLKNETGAVIHILHTTREVTAEYEYKQRQKQLEFLLHQSQQQNNSFINENPDGIFRMNRDGIIKYSNQSLAKITDMPVEEIVGTHFEKFSCSYHKDYIFEHFYKALKGEKTSFEADFVNTQEKIMQFKVYLMPIFFEGVVQELQGIVKDVSHLRKTEKVIVEKNRFLEVHANFINCLLQADFCSDVLHQTFGNIASTVQVDRMYYCSAAIDCESASIAINQKLEWRAPHLKSRIFNANMQGIPLQAIEEIITPLQKNQPFIAHFSSAASSVLKTIFNQQEIKTVLLLPIFVEEQLFGFIGFDNCKQERNWKQEEISFLRSLAQNLAQNFEKSEALIKVRKREEELRLSEQKFKALVHEGSDLIAILDLSGNYSFVSDNYQKHLGFHQDELLHNNCYPFIHPQDRERVMHQFKTLKNKSQIVTSPFRFTTKTGTYRWMQTIATNLTNDKAVNGIIANSRDITTLIEQAKEIENINERYRLAATATQDLIYDWDLEKNTIVRFHGGLKKLFGYSSECVNKMNFWRDFIHPDDYRPERKKLLAAIRNPNIHFVNTEYRFRRFDGSYAQIVDRGYLIRDFKGRAVRLIGATSDISEITAKKEELRIANKRFKIAMKATNEMIWDWEVATDVVTRNKGYQSIFGYPSDEASSVHSFWMEKVVPEDRERVRKSLALALQNSTTQKWEQEYQFVKANGQIAHIIDRGYILRHKNGEAYRIIGAVLDVTHSRNLIHKVQTQNKILKEVAWKQSHVVRAPVARIKGLLSLLEEDTFTEMSRDKILFHLRESANELDNIIGDIIEKTESLSIETH